MKNQNKSRTLVFVGAHPDDESFGTGAILAQYAAAGVKTYYICATRGEAGTVEPKYMVGYSSIGDMRWAELTCAARALGLTGFFHLGYRDSGMPGNPDNEYEGALMKASIEEVAGRLVKLFREIKPGVVITHNSEGGYGHPDHISVHQATVKAFYAAGDARQYPEAGRAFQPSKLYYGVRPHKLMKIVIRLMPLFGQDPHHFGRNHDVDLYSMIKIDYPVHAAVPLTKESLEARRKAAACHASQGGGQPPRGGMGLFGLMNTILGVKNSILGQRDYFMREYPPPDHRGRERDLFDGVTWPEG